MEDSNNVLYNVKSIADMVKTEQGELVIHSALTVFIRCNYKVILDMCIMAQKEAKMCSVAKMIENEWKDVDKIAKRLLLCAKLLFRDVTCGNSLNLYHLISGIVVVDKIEELLCAKLIHVRNCTRKLELEWKFKINLRSLELSAQYALNSLIAERNLEYPLAKLWIAICNSLGLNYHSPLAIPQPSYMTEEMNWCTEGTPDYSIKGSYDSPVLSEIDLAYLPATSLYYNDMKAVWRFFQASDAMWEGEEVQPAWLLPITISMECRRNQLVYLHHMEDTSLPVETLDILKMAAALMQTSSEETLAVYKDAAQRYGETQAFVDFVHEVYKPGTIFLSIVLSHIKTCACNIQKCMEQPQSSLSAPLWDRLRLEYVAAQEQHHATLAVLVNVKPKEEICTDKEATRWNSERGAELKLLHDSLMYLEGLLERRVLYTEALAEAEATAVVARATGGSDRQSLLQDCWRNALSYIDTAIGQLVAALGTTGPLSVLPHRCS